MTPRPADARRFPDRVRSDTVAALHRLRHELETGEIGMTPIRLFGGPLADLAGPERLPLLLRALGDVEDE